MLASLALSALLIQTPVPEGRVLEHVPFARPDGRSAHATVYLPAGYDDQKERRYPVLYLLHGLFGRDTDWLKLGVLQSLLDGAIQRGELRPTIVVMPDGGNGYWVDWPDGDPRHRYQTLVEPDTRLWVESRFRVNGVRAVGGVSMGGFGALSLALRHPETYPAVISLSGALFRQPPTARRTYLRAFGYPGVTSRRRFPFVNPLDLVHLGRADGLHVWLDCGREDRPKFVQGLLAVSDALTRRGITHVARFRPGRHTWNVWLAGLAEAFTWLDAQLEAAGP